MSKQDLSQELGIVYYRTMSKVVQYRRNLLRNNLSSLQEKIFPKHKFAQGVMQ